LISGFSGGVSTVLWKCHW